MDITFLEEMKIRIQYDKFIKTEAGMKWKEFWKGSTNSDTSGNFNNFLHDFYPDIFDMRYRVLLEE